MKVIFFEFYLTYLILGFGEDCNENKINYFKLVKRFKRTESLEACRDICNNNARCDVFKFKVKTLLLAADSSSMCLNVVCLSVCCLLLSSSKIVC